MADGLGDALTPARASTLPPPIIRSTKLGQRLYVEVDFIVAKGEWQVDEEDAVRLAITERLDALGLLVWATIDLTTNPAMAADCPNAGSQSVPDGHRCRPGQRSCSGRSSLSC